MNTFAEEDRGDARSAGAGHGGPRRGVPWEEPPRGGRSCGVSPVGCPLHAGGPATAGAHSSPFGPPRSPRRSGPSRSPACSTVLVPRPSFRDRPARLSSQEPRTQRKAAPPSGSARRRRRPWTAHDHHAGAVGASPVPPVPAGAAGPRRPARPRRSAACLDPAPWPGTCRDLQGPLRRAAFRPPPPDTPDWPHDMDTRPGLADRRGRDGGARPHRGQRPLVDRQ